MLPAHYIKMSQQIFIGGVQLPLNQFYSSKIMIMCEWTFLKQTMKPLISLSEGKYNPFFCPKLKLLKFKTLLFPPLSFRKTTDNASPIF